MTKKPTSSDMRTQPLTDLKMRLPMRLTAVEEIEACATFSAYGSSR